MRKEDFTLYWIFESLSILLRINGGVLCADALETVLGFLPLKAAQRIPAEDIHAEGFACFVPESFKPNRGVQLTFRPQER
jgi:hypothetical protein